MPHFGVIGPGNLGKCLLHHLCSKNHQPYFYHRRPERCGELAFLGTSVDLKTVLTCDYVFITVKPSSVSEICQEIQAHLETSPTFISVIAGVPLEYLKCKLGTNNVIRAMFDVGIILGSISVFGYASEEMSIDCLQSLGIPFRVKEEAFLDTITAVVGCGPAFLAKIYQAYTNVAREFGVGEEAVRELWLNCPHLISCFNSPQNLIMTVASKGGATERGLQHLDIEEDLRKCISTAEQLCRGIRISLLK